MEECDVQGSKHEILKSSPLYKVDDFKTAYLLHGRRRSSIIQKVSSSRKDDALYGGMFFRVDPL